MPVLFLWHDVHAWCCFRKVQLIFLPPGTCPTASYKFQPWNQICCELWRRCARCHLFHHTCFHNRGNSALPFHDSTHLFILPSTVTNYLHQQNGAHKEWPPAESMSKFMLTGSCGNSLKKKKRIWWNWSAQTALLVIQPAANLKYGMQLILNTFGDCNQACKNYSICRTTVEQNQCKGDSSLQWFVNCTSKLKCRSEQVFDAQWLESNVEPAGQGLSPGLAPKKRPLVVTLKVKSCPVGRGSLYRPFLDPIIEFLSILGLNPGRSSPKGQVFC